MYTRVLLGALVALAAAQSKVLTFTHVPSPITDGEAQAILYSTNDTISPVTITLRKGDSADLSTVDVLTTSATGGQFIWTPCDNLADGSDYALEISQAGQVNYFGPFEVQGASGEGSCNTSAANATSSSVSSTATGVVPGGAASSLTSSAALNSTTMTSIPASIGTGVPVSRNATMSSATLGSESTVMSSAMTSSSSGGSAMTATATTTSGTAQSQSSTAAASASSTGAAAASAVLVCGSTVALACGVIAAVVMG